MPKPKMGYDSFGIRHAFLSPFLRKYRTRSGVWRLDPALIPVAHHLVVSGDERLVYANNAKAACTSITSVIYKYTFGDTPDRSDAMGDDPRFRYGVDFWKENTATLNSGKAFVFTSVRDPLARSLSAFRNVFIDRGNRFSRVQRRAIRKFGFRDTMATSAKFDVFLDYVETSLALAPLRTDQHFRRQVDNVAYGHVTYDHIVRVENLAEDLVRIPELAGIDDPHAAFVQQPHRNRSNPLAFSPDAEQRARIFAIYGPDYEAFGYTPDL